MTSVPTSAQVHKFRIPMPGETAVLVALACAFIAFHVLVGTIMQRAHPESGAKQEVALDLYGD